MCSISQVYPAISRIIYQRVNKEKAPRHLQLVLSNIFPLLVLLNLIWYLIQQDSSQMFCVKHISQLIVLI